MHLFHRSLAILLLLWGSAVAQAQSAQEVIEKARAEARQFNDYKVALEDPDQSVRLAVFEAMLQQSSPPLRMMAIETGITSTDSILRSRALQAQLLGMDQLHMRLSVNPKASKVMQDNTRKRLEQTNGAFAERIRKRDLNEGTFETGSFRFQVRNLNVLLTMISGNANASFTLQDDNTLTGIYTDPSNNFSAEAVIILF